MSCAAAREGDPDSDGRGLGFSSRLADFRFDDFRGTVGASSCCNAAVFFENFRAGPSSPPISIVGRVEGCAEGPAGYSSSSSELESESLEAVEAFRFPSFRPARFSFSSPLLLESSSPLVAVATADCRSSCCLLAASAASSISLRISGALALLTTSKPFPFSLLLPNLLNIHPFATAIGPVGSAGPVPSLLEGALLDNAGPLTP